MAQASQKWPEELSNASEQITRRVRQGVIAPGQVVVFAMSLVYEHVKHLPKEERMQKYDDIVSAFRTELEKLP